MGLHPIRYGRHAPIGKVTGLARIIFPWVPTVGGRDASATGGVRRESLMERRVRFGPFEFDQQTGELCKNGVKIRLQEKPRQVLAALLERPGKPISRKALQERLWSDDTFVDFDSGLNTAANRLRITAGR